MKLIEKKSLNNFRLTAKAAELVEEEEDMANLMIHFRHQAHLMTRPPTSVLKNVWMFYFMNSHSEMLPVFRALKLRRMQAQYNVCLKKVIKYIFGGSFFFE